MNAAVSPHLRSLEALQAQISVQDEISCLLREQLHDLRINRDAWRTQAQAVQHILVDGRPRRRLLGWTPTIGQVDALFRHGILLILLAAVLLIPSNLIPVNQAHIDAVLQCLLPAFPQPALPAEKTGISKLRFVAPAYTSEDRDYLIKTIVFEASGESEDGKAAVAHVILTRKRSGKWGDTIKDVVTHPGQFESWMTKRAEMESLDVEDYRYRSAAQIADAVLAGKMSDPTTGATHFLNPTVVGQRRGGSLPSWATAGGLSIGRHTFYAPNARWHGRRESRDLP
jgi:N-acetylmuramoyl-L-alanine amidase